VRIQYRTFGEHPSHRAIANSIPQARAGIDFSIKEEQRRNTAALGFAGREKEDDLLANKRRI
jgi:hypothetical protein